MSTGKVLVMLAVVAVMAAPSFGAINVRVLVNGQAAVPWPPGGPVNVSVEAMCDHGVGVFCGGGSVVTRGGGLAYASGGINLNATDFPGPMPPYLNNDPGTDPGDGGWNNFGVSQIAIPASARDPSVGNGMYVEFCNYDIVGVSPWIWFDFVNNAGAGLDLCATDDDPTVGTFYGALIGIPEPASLALLALGGVAVLRRR